MSAGQATAIDPICGMTVKTATAIQAVKDGQTYYFCCPKCKERFLAGEEVKGPQLITLSLPTKKGIGPSLPIGPATHATCPSDPAPTAQPHACCHHNAEELIVPSSASAYFCPMCPGEESNEPGYCGTCGMALERNPNFHNPAADEALARAEARFRIKVFVTMLLAAIVFLLAMSPMLGLPLHRLLSPWQSGWLQCFLTTPVLLLAWPYWVSGFGALRKFSANMFTLIGLGAWSAFGLSLLYLLAPDAFPQFANHAGMHGTAADDVAHLPLYFESAAVIVALVMLGQWLEGSARKRTASDLEKLVAMLPKLAHRIEGQELVDVDPLQLKVGDRLLIKSGEVIPADAILEEGRSDVDESLLTGESLPVTKTVGDRLVAGSTNHIAVLKARVVAAGPQSVLAQIIQRVGNAQRSRAPIQDTVDRITVYFVPMVVVIALLAASGWYWFGPEPKPMHAFLAALSVLVIACPCALGLATPMSIMVGVGRAAREGILVRDAKVFQSLAAVDTIVLDKTGTLTEGKPEVVTWQCSPESDPKNLWSFALALEQTSEHPIAQAITNFARRELGSKVTTDVVSQSIETIAGAGTLGWVKGKRIAIGKKDWLSTLLPLGAMNQEWLQASADSSQSEAWMAVDDQCVACMYLADAPRDMASSSIERLRELGMELHLLSGDRNPVVESMARRLGIKHYRGEVSPEQKREEIVRLKGCGKKVAMVGDGVNDAPALATADVGIAMASGTDLAQQSSDVTLLEGDLRRIVAAITLSRQVVSNIQQNLTLGLMYNVIALPVAAGVFYPWTGWTLSPMVAAAAMAASSLSVVGNALRLRFQSS